MSDQLTSALKISFELIRQLDIYTGFSMREPIQETESACNCTIDGASPMSIWPHFTAQDGTRFRVHMAYPRTGHTWGLPIVSEIDAIPSLIAYYQL